MSKYISCPKLSNEVPMAENPDTVLPPQGFTFIDNKDALLNFWMFLS